ncbi:hypothetical protein M422DRAFT_244099, partial [Sphaerobolus stellatus SS14]
AERAAGGPPQPRPKPRPIVAGQPRASPRWTTPVPPAGAAIARSASPSKAVPVVLLPAMHHGSGGTSVDGDGRRQSPKRSLEDLNKDNDLNVPDSRSRAGFGANKVARTPGSTDVASEAHRRYPSVQQDAAMDAPPHRPRVPSQRQTPALDLPAAPPTGTAVAFVD